MRMACTFPTFTKHCVKASIIVAAALSVSTASARPIQVLVKPGTGQASVMHRGIQMAASSGPGSEIWILTAEPDEGKRVKLAFVFVNNSDRPITIGPESITAETLTVVPWEVLAQEQRRREGRRKFGNFLAGLGNSIGAANAGYSHGSFHYSGFNSRGTHYSGVGSVTTYNPYVARVAQAEAAEQDAARAERMYHSFASQRAELNSNLRTTTVMPQQKHAGYLTFEFPDVVRRKGGVQQFSIAVRVGADTHRLDGFVGEAGTLPEFNLQSDLLWAKINAQQQPTGNGFGVVPASVPVSSGAGRSAARGVNTALPSPVTNQTRNGGPAALAASSATIDAYTRGEYIGRPEPLADLARQGFAPAQNELGEMYQLGRSVRQDDKEAVRLYRLAADQGNRQALVNLAWMLENGQGGARNLVAAKRYYGLAAKQGDRIASDRLIALSALQ